MKLSEVTIKERIPATAYARFGPDQFDLSFESGLVTITHRAKGETWLVPLSNVIFMKVAPTDEAPKKGPSK